MGQHRPTLLIIGASTRAAAWSSLRAGFQPVCIDQFADADLRPHVSVHAVESLASLELAQQNRTDSGASLKAFLASNSELPIVLAGGMENHLDVVTKLSQTRSLWGAKPSAIGSVRQPDLLVRGMREVKQQVLEVIRAPEPPPPRDGSWMLKPISSAGGRGITIWDDTNPGLPLTDSESGAEVYFQRRVPGDVYSALFIASCQPGDVRFVGLTKQLVGRSELNAAPFAWCGNIGPAFLPVEAEFLVRRWGNILKWKFGLTGLFGIDFMVGEDDRPWMLEVNPRWTGSVEILEAACGLSLMTAHVACYAPEVAEAAQEHAAPAIASVRDRVGRAILYAPQRLIARIPVPEMLRWDVIPSVADIPDWGATIEAGSPLCSVYAWGDEEQDVESKLWSAAAGILDQCEMISDPPV